jgi:dTMP kinase
MFLFAAARCDHVRRLIAPALERGAHVVCDRFSDSTRAYQGGARGLSPSMVEAVDLIARGTWIPDVTLLLDLPAEEGLARAGRRRGAASSIVNDRFEGEDLAFHRRVRSAFLRLAGQEPHRLWVIDATGDAESVARSVEAVIRRTLPELLGGPTPRQAKP